MDEIRDGLAAALKKTKPKLYHTLAFAVRLGLTKEAIMARVAGEIRPDGAGALTAGCCEAVLDLLLAERQQRSGL